MLIREFEHMLQALPIIRDDVRLNRCYGEWLGWKAYRNAIAEHLGFVGYVPDEEEFADAIWGWQIRHGLKADGIIGPDTLAGLHAEIGWPPPPEPPDRPGWIRWDPTTSHSPRRAESFVMKINMIYERANAAQIVAIPKGASKSW